MTGLLGTMKKGIPHDDAWTHNHPRSCIDEPCFLQCSMAMSAPPVWVTSSTLKLISLDIAWHKGMASIWFRLASMGMPAQQDSSPFFVQLIGNACTSCPAQMMDKGPEHIFMAYRTAFGDIGPQLATKRWSAQLVGAALLLQSQPRCLGLKAHGSSCL